MTRGSLLAGLLLALQTCRTAAGDGQLFESGRLCRQVWDNFHWLAGNKTLLKKVGIDPEELLPEEGQATEQCCSLPVGEQCCRTAKFGKLCFDEKRQVFNATEGKPYADFMLTMQSVGPGSWVGYFAGGSLFSNGSFWENCTAKLNASEAEVADYDQTDVRDAECVLHGRGDMCGHNNESSYDFPDYYILCRAFSRTETPWCCNGTHDGSGLYDCFPDTELRFDALTHDFFVSNSGHNRHEDERRQGDSITLTTHLGDGRFVGVFEGGDYYEIVLASPDHWAASKAHQVHNTTDEKAWELIPKDEVGPDAPTIPIIDFNGMDVMLDARPGNKPGSGDFALPGGLGLGGGMAAASPDDPSATETTTNREGCDVFDDYDDDIYANSLTSYFVRSAQLSESQKRECFQDRYSFEPLDMPGQAPKKMSSVEECQKHCRDTPGCAHFSYWTPQGHCHLQDAFAYRSPTRLLFISGPPTCESVCDRVRPPACFTGASRLTPAMTSFRGLTIDGCLDECRQHAECSKVSFSSLSSICLLHSEDARLTEAITPGWVSRNISCGATDAEEPVLVSEAEAGERLAAPAVPLPAVLFVAALCGLALAVAAVLRRPEARGWRSAGDAPGLPLVAPTDLEADEQAE